MIKIIICGSRDYSNSALIENFIKSLPKEAEIIQGEAKGADSLARDMAKKHGLKVHSFPADWNKHGINAGPIRNKKMLDEGKPTHVVGYSDDIMNSRGTKNMLTIAKKAGVPTYLNVANWSEIEHDIVEIF